MVTSKIAFLAALGATVLSAETVRANTCSWWDPFDPAPQQTYSGVSVVSNGGGSLGSARVVIDFWGTLNPASSHYSGQDVTIKSNVTKMIGDSHFWSRYAQYGISSGSLLGVSYNEPTLYNASITDSQIQSTLDLEQLDGEVPFGYFLNPTSSISCSWARTLRLARPPVAASTAAMQIHGCRLPTRTQLSR